MYVNFIPKCIQITFPVQLTGVLMGGVTNLVRFN